MVPIGNASMLKKWIVDNVDMPVIKRCFTSGEPITEGTGVYMSTDGKVYTYDTANKDTYIGIASDSVYANKSVTIILQGYLKVPFSGWDKGILYYMDSSGNLVTTATNKKVAVGVAKDAIIVYNNLDVIDVTSAVREEFLVGEPGALYAGASTYTITGDGIIEDSLSISLDGTDLPQDRTDRISYTVVYNPTNAVVTFNQAMQNDQYYIFKCLKNSI
jgi:hypothetical protein